MEFFDKEVVKSKKESSNLSRSSICVILQQNCGHRVVQFRGVVLSEDLFVERSYQEVHGCFHKCRKSRETTACWKWEVTKVYPQQLDFRC